jgi:hypothetical protein
MPQTLDGKEKNHNADSYTVDVGVWRHHRHRYDFDVSGGAQGTFTLFTVTGDVMVQLFGVCQTALTSGGAATVEVGITGNTAALIAQTAFDDVDQYETWQDAAPEANPGNVDAAMADFFVIANGADVILTVATADLTAGVIDFDAFWCPLSTDGSVTP